MIGNVLKQLGGAKLADRGTVYRDLMNARAWEDGDSLPALPPTQGDLSTYMRVSSLGYLCARLESIKIANKLALRGSMDAESAYTFILGRHHHDMMQSTVVPALLHERMRGWWACDDKLHADSISDGQRNVPRLLAKPDDGKRWQYVEMVATDHEHFLTGHPDMVVDWTGSGVQGVPDAPEVQEYKSKDPVSWAGIDPEQGGYPDPTHVIQTQAYMWLLGLEHGRIVYIKKGERRIQDAFVEWPIRSDPDTIAGIQATLVTYWDAVVAAHASGKWYEHKLKKCSKFDAGRAAGCPLRYECHDRTWRKVRTDVRPMTPIEIINQAIKKEGGK